MAAGQTEQGDGGKKQVTRFTDEIGNFSNENTKAVMLNTAEKILSALHDIMVEASQVDGGDNSLFSTCLLICFSLDDTFSDDDRARVFETR